MFSFIDKTAQEAGAKPDEMLNVRRFHVKRRSGKVFGPFEEAVIVKMLEDGQLLGNEEVSLDAESWHAIGTEPALQAVIARLMEAPARTQTQAQLQAVDDARGPSMDRLKQLYEGRMAAVAVVQSKEPIPFKKKLPFIILGVLLTIFLVGGVGLGVATPYGFFALKVLFPAKVKPDTREFGYLQVARKSFLQDTWKSYKLAKDSANQALQIKDYPEARAVWCQAVFYLDRKFGKAEPAELEQAQNELVNVRLLGDKHPEVLKTEASAALSRKDADSALATIADAVARDSDDLESLFLRAEAYLMKKQPAQAKAEFEAILKKDPKSAKALHGLGMLAKQQNEVNEAAGKLAEALEADPMHLVSAVELAEITIVRRKEVERGNELLEKALSDEGRPMLSPSALGKGLALKAETLVVQGKLSDAVPLFEEAIKADPGNAFTNGRLAHAYAELNQPDKAAPLFQVAVRSAAGGARVHRGLPLGADPAGEDGRGHQGDGVGQHPLPRRRHPLVPDRAGGRQAGQHQGGRGGLQAGHRGGPEDHRRLPLPLPQLHARPPLQGSAAGAGDGPGPGARQRGHPRGHGRAGDPRAQPRARRGRVQEGHRVEPLLGRRAPGRLAGVPARRASSSSPPRRWRRRCRSTPAFPAGGCSAAWRCGSWGGSTRPSPSSRRPMRPTRRSPRSSSPSAR